jgi:hypothetical protein
MTLPGHARRTPPSGRILIVRVFGLPCVFCQRRADRLIVHPRGVSTVHEQPGWPPCDFPNPADHRTGAVRPTVPIRPRLAAADGGLTTRRSA